MTKRVITLFFLLAVFLLIPSSGKADVLQQKITFSIDPSFDLHARKEVTASLQSIGDRLYLYVEEDWWNTLTAQEQNETKASLSSLGTAFEDEIYPVLTDIFGTERNPGIDNDARITVLLHEMGSNIRGYINTADGYPKLQTSLSNEREMLYLNTSDMLDPLLKSYLAHEFMHLIQFNQKEFKYSVQDETWLLEGVAELAPTLVGYDSEPAESYLEKRKNDFTANPRDSVTEWQGVTADYGVVHIFFQYVREKYGLDVLTSIVQSSQIGIAAFDEALVKHGFEKNFSDVFTDWEIAVFINDCSYGLEYCFESDNLSDLKVTAFTSFLSPFGNSELTVTNQTKDWAGNWYKLSGGKEILEVEFNGNPESSLVVPYIIQTKSGEDIIGFFDLSEDQQGGIVVENFGKENTALIIMPSTRNQTTGFTSFVPAYFFSWIASTSEPEEQVTEENNEINPEVQTLLLLIAELQAQVVQLQIQLAQLTGTYAQISTVGCSNLEVNLYVGIQNREQVRCLQEFLGKQGPEIYPEGLITGNFLSLTEKAVIRFQEKYAQEILAPFGLVKGTGYVGQLTREKINDLNGSKFLTQTGG